jgi:tetratricopeptide (TPR) repeat protein
VASKELGDAIQLIKSGNRQAALPILKEILQENPGDEQAWLWLYACVDKVQEKRYCLQKALEINPDNQPARAALEKLAGPAPSPSGQILDKPATPAALASENKPAKRKSKWRPVVVALELICLAFLCLVLAALVFPAAAIRLSMVLPTRPPGALPTANPSPISYPIAPFTPGNPTATPLGSDITDPNFTAGLAAYHAGQYQSAVNLMSKVIVANPKLAPPYRYRGMAYFNLNECKEGLSDINEALDINPVYASAWAGRGALETCLGEDAIAIQDLQKALSFDGSLAVAHHNLGAAYYRVGLFEKALAEYSLTVAIDPGRSAAWVGKGLSAYKLGFYDDCIQSSTKALEVNPKELSAYVSRAGCELILKKTDEAMQDYATFEKNHQNGQYGIGLEHGDRGDAYFVMKDYVHAIEDYKIAVSLLTGDAHSYCQLAYAYFETKQYQNALDAGNSSIAIDPRCGGRKLRVVMARSSYALGDYDQALASMKNAFAIYENPAPPLDYYYRGIIFQALGKNAEAIKDLKQFLASNPASNEGADAQDRLSKLAP